MWKIGIIIGAVLIAAGLIAAIFTGTIPLFSILGDEGFETQKNWHENIQGNTWDELILPNYRKGFITSYRTDIAQGVSESITVAGHYKQQQGLWHVQKVKYVVKYVANPWEDLKSDDNIISAPGKGNTVSWVTVENPDVIDDLLWGLIFRDERYVKPYVFQLRGPHKGAIRVEFWGYVDTTFLLPGGEKWKLLSSDQAMLESGKCSIWAPKKEDGTYATIFEIGEKAIFSVETGMGAPEILATTDENGTRPGDKTWELRLIRKGGEEYTGQGFPMQIDDNFKGEKSFVVQPDMWIKGESNRYDLQIWNVLWKEGAIAWSTIDFKAKAPSKPTISPNCGLSVKKDTNVGVTLTATPNTETQLAVESFGVVVWYGMHEDLNPGTWGDDRWIVRETFVTAQGSGGTYTGTFTFPVVQPGRYLTIIAYTHDVDGRDSDTEYYQIKSYDEEKPDDEDLIDEGGGQGSYGGGESGETTPLGFWELETAFDWLGIIVAIAVGVILGALTFLIPMPKIEIRVVVAIIVAVISIVLIYYFYYVFNGGIGGGA